VAITGSATLAGTLAVSLIGGFTPQAGETFDILISNALSGSFDTLQLPELTGGMMWDTSQLYTSGALSVVETFLPGDFNRDGHVDASDILPMMKALTDLSGYKTTYDPTLTAAQLLLIGDLDGDNKFTNTDLQALLNLLQSGGGSANPVPEPAAFTLLTLAAISLIVARARWRPRKNVRNHSG
jgi:hypothetical protein